VQIAPLEVQERTKNSCLFFRPRQELLECSRRKGRMATTLSQAAAAACSCLAVYEILTSPGARRPCVAEGRGRCGWLLIAIQAVKT